MKTLLTIMLIFVKLISYGHACDTINERIVNCIDINGLKQGLWENWVYEWRQEKNYEPVSVFCQTAPLVKTRIKIKSKGEFTDNRKTGKWEYYRDEGCYISITRTEHYYQDGSFDLTRDNFNVHYNSDSTSVLAKTLMTKDTVYITCQNKLCKTTFDKFTLYEFNQESNNLEIESIKIEGGVYYDKIRKIKTNANKL